MGRSGNTDTHDPNALFISVFGLPHAYDPATLLILGTPLPAGRRDGNVRHVHAGMT